MGLFVSIWLYFGFVCLGGAEHGTAEHVRLGIKDGVGRRCCKKPFKRSFVSDVAKRLLLAMLKSLFQKDLSLKILQKN